jgi:hypothetical protein
VTDRPIIFSGPMVRALIEGRKTQTRRVLKEQAVGGVGAILRTLRWQWRSLTTDGYIGDVRVPYAPGDRLWVREAHFIHPAHGQGRADGVRWGPWGGLPMAVSPDGATVAYYRDGFDRSPPGRWRPSIHMPRWASRLTLTVTEVRVQRLQDISEADAVAEGVAAVTLEDVPRPAAWSLRQDFSRIWNTLHGPDAWDANPWVAAVTFTVERGNIDQLRAKAAEVER